GVTLISCFNRESDSVTVGAFLQSAHRSVYFRFQSRKRFRHCWSHREDWLVVIRSEVSIAKAIPSLLELEMPCLNCSSGSCFNRESDSVTVGAPHNRCARTKRPRFNRE